MLPLFKWVGSKLNLQTLLKWISKIAKIFARAKKPFSDSSLLKKKLLESALKLLFKFVWSHIWIIMLSIYGLCKYKCKSWGLITTENFKDQKLVYKLCLKHQGDPKLWNYIVQLGKSLMFGQAEPKILAWLTPIACWTRWTWGDSGKVLQPMLLNAVDMWLQSRYCELKWSNVCSNVQYIYYWTLSSKYHMKGNALGCLEGLLKQRLVKEHSRIKAWHYNGLGELL